LFLSGQNLRYVILTALPMIALGGGQLCVLLVGGFDISVAANLSLATGLLTVLAAGALAPSLAIPGVLAVLAVGTLIGLGNGSFVKLVRINPLVATMAMMSLLQGVALFVRPVYGGTVHSVVVDALGIKVGFVPVVFIILVAAAALAEVWLRRSGDGLRTRATGLHEESARRNGVATSRLQLRAYALCGTLAAFAGLLLAAQTGIGDPRAGDSLLLVSFTAPFLAGASLFGGRGSFVGTVLAALFLAAILNAFTLMEVPRPIGVIISGALTLLAIALYSGRSWRMGRSAPA
jgi:ribose transport system ATP-binding protein